MTGISDISPSTKDLMQFISPNPTDTEIIYLIHEQDIKAHETKFVEWEEANICALIVDTQSTTQLVDESSLTQASEEMSCPILRMQDAERDKDLIESRTMGFDGQIISVKNMSAENFQNLYTLAESMHFRLIPLITSQNDYEKVLGAQPKFIYLASLVEDNLSEQLENSKIWLMGKEEMKDKFKLKCLIKEV